MNNIIIIFSLITDAQDLRHQQTVDDKSPQRCLP